MPQVSAASAHAFMALLEHHHFVPHPDKQLLHNCKFIIEEMGIPKDIGGLWGMLDDVNNCRALCNTELATFTEYIDVLDMHLAEAEKYLGAAVELPCYKDRLGVVKKTRTECVKQKERYNDAMMALLFIKEEIKTTIDILKHEAITNDHEWVWVSDEHCLINLKDWVDVEEEVDA